MQPVADVKQVMSVILEPAADTYWDAVGTVSDTTGTTEIAPRNVEEWAEVWRAALVVAESGNLLMMEGRARDRDQWMRLARQMVERWVVGTPEAAATQVRQLATTFGVDEVMVHPVAGAAAGTDARRSPAREETLRLLAG